MVDHYPQSAAHQVGIRAGGASTGRNITSNASTHTKGAYVEMLASLTNDAQGLYIMCAWGNVNNGFLIDVATGAAASEVIIINNLYVTTSTNWSVGGAGFYAPISVPAGTRLSVRCQCETGSQVINVCLNAIEAKGSSVGFTRCETIGANTGTSRGTTIDAGGTADTKGAYAQISAAVGGNYKYVGIATGANGDFSISVDTWSLVDISTGEAASEVVIFGDFPYMNDTVIDTNVVSHITIPLRVDAGTRVAMRHQSFSNAADARLIDSVLYGFYNPPPSPSPSIFSTSSPLTIEKPPMWAAGAHAFTAGEDRQLHATPSPLFTLPLWEGSGPAKSLDQTYNLPLGGSASWTDTEWGMGVNFDGTGDSLIVDNSNLAVHPLKPQFPFTIECVAIQTAAAAYIIWTNDYRTTVYSGINLEFLSSQNWQLLLGNNGGGGSTNRRNWGTSAIGPIPLGTPSHLIWIQDSLTVARAYVNGIDAGLGAPSGTGNALTYTANNIEFGLDGRAGGADLNGKILFFELYDFAYTDEYALTRSRDIWSRLRMPN